VEDFCAVELRGPGGSLWIDSHGEATPESGSFSLVQIKDCPGSTVSCRAACLAHELERHRPETHELYRRNSETVRKVLKDPSAADEWAAILGRWIAENCPAGFRWHVSGDIFSIDYAEWIASVCRRSPQVRHRILTRSLQFLGPLLPVRAGRGGNLELNLSADEDNWQRVGRKADLLELQVAYMTADGRIPISLLPGDMIFPPRAASSEWFDELSPEYKQMVRPVDHIQQGERDV
jgi:hypothetical protein